MISELAQALCVGVSGVVCIMYTGAPPLGWLLIGLAALLVLRALSRRFNWRLDE